MKKILFVCTHRLNRSPSQRFRFEQYLDLLEDNGIDYDISYLITAKEYKKYYSKGFYGTKILILFKSLIKRFNDFLRANKFDFIFIQREAFMIGTSLFEKLFSLTQAKIIFDFDDAIWLYDLDGGNKDFGWLKSPSKTYTIIKLADIVVAGNNFLAEYARRISKNVCVIPTTIDTDIYIPFRNHKKSDQICIGWSGSFSTVKHFELILPVLKKIKEQFGEKVIFFLVGSKYSNPLISIESKDWNYETELQDLNQFDIGIMPLPANDWSRGKCGLKGLQYMALEIATVMSPIGVNTEIIENGVNGFLATSDEEWFDSLSKLIESKELRLELGKNGRKTVIERYSTKSQQENFLKLFA